MMFGPKRLIFGLVMAALSALVVPEVRAQDGVGDPSLEEAEERLARSRGPEVYEALRRIWSTYNRADPLRTETALRRAETAPGLTPAERVYAGVLVANARTRRGDLTAAREHIRNLGFIRDWLIVGPFDNEGKTGLELEHEPETQLNAPLIFGQGYAGKGQRAVRWRAVSGASPDGWLSAASLVRPEKKVCLYAKAYVSHDSPVAKRASVWVGTGGAFKLFWNGEEVLKDTAYRGADVDRFRAEVELLPGPNDLTLKLCGEELSPVGAVRVADINGAPHADIKYSIDPQFSERIAERGPVPHGGVRQRSGGGAVQEFEELMRRSSNDPRTLEAYARYLVATGGDDLTVHRARDLARAAADTQPTVPRLLLAGRLAEDRNQRAEWIERAIQLAGDGAKSNKELLLARASLGRESLNWRSAFPFYEEVLRLDPSDITAIRGRVELYNEAGLRRTALGVLEAALNRAPTSVSLLNMYASQLRALGRAAEADAAETRYFALRFDDRGFIHRKLQLALSRRNHAAAQRWIDRMIELDPGNLWVHDAAARAYQGLGEPQRAIAAYQRALELAPEDVSTLRALSDIHGQLGNREEQLRLLEEILKLKPQAKDIREYVEHLEPAEPRQDESFAWNEDQFLKERHVSADGESQRTLLDLAVTTVFENGLSSEFRQVVYQPLTDSAAAIGRQYSFQYEADRQRVQLRGAKVYRADGKIDEAIESGEGAANNPALAMYTSSRTFYIQLPRLEPGDVVELRYRIDDVSTVNEFNDYFGDIHYMNSSEPVRHARYVLIAPKQRDLHFDVQRVPGIKQSVKELAEQRVYSFAADLLPAIVPEPAMPPWPEVLGFIHVSTYRSYQELGAWYWGLAKDQFDLDEETRRLARKITAGLSTDREKVVAVYNWVIKNTRYVALEFGIYGFKPRRCVQTVSRGWGDCKDKATVIVSLLKELGIDSTIVVLRTQQRGRFDSKVASLAPFDHAIAYVPSLDLYLDGTAEFTGSEELPAMDAGALGILVNQGQSKLVTLPPLDPAKNVQSSEVLGTLLPDGSARLTLTYQTVGAEAPSWRNRYHAVSTQRQRVAEDLAPQFPGFELMAGPAGLNVSDLDKVEEPARVIAKGTARHFARRELNGSLSMTVTTPARLTGTYASLSQRKLAVEIPAFSTRRQQAVLEVPSGWRVLSGPQNVKVNSRFGGYSVSVKEESGRVTVDSSLHVSVSRVTPAEYSEWRAFCQAADAALSKRLVVGK